MVLEEQMVLLVEQLLMTMQTHPAHLLMAALDWAVLAAQQLVIARTGMGLEMGVETVHLDAAESWRKLQTFEKTLH
jgi:hypothetical protein